MGWIGTLAGAFIGSRLGGALGGLIGAAFGSVAEEKLKRKLSETLVDGEADNGGGTAGRRGSARENREAVMLAAMSAMFAKMAKADGVVSHEEIAVCEQAFARIGLYGEKRAFCVRAFRRAKDDNYSIFDYAAEFASHQRSSAVRELVYGILWELAAADGTLHPAELAILKRITGPLAIAEWCYVYKAAEYGVGGRSRARREQGDGANRRRGSAGESSGADPYATLGVKRSDDTETIKRAYRALAKRYHPDTLRRNGLSEELMSRATERMSRINAAWDEIKRERKVN